MDGVGDAVAVVCDDRPAVRAPVVRLLLATGFVVAATTEDFAELRQAVSTHEARVAVVALPLTGMPGLRAVRALRAQSPGCEVVLLSSSGSLASAAVAVGAHALVPERDLRVLRTVLLELAAARALPRLPHQRADAAASVSTNPSS